MTEKKDQRTRRLVGGLESTQRKGGKGGHLARLEGCATIEICAENVCESVVALVWVRVKYDENIDGHTRAFRQLE